MVGEGDGRGGGDGEGAGEGVDERASEAGVDAAADAAALAATGVAATGGPVPPLGAGLAPEPQAPTIRASATSAAAAGAVQKCRIIGGSGHGSRDPEIGRREGSRWRSTSSATSF